MLMRLSAKLFVTPLVLLTCAFAPTASAANNYELALQAYNEDKVDYAYIHIKNAIQQQPDDLSSRFLLAKILLELKQYGQAEQEVVSALVQGLDINLGVPVLGQSLIMQGKFLAVFDIARDDLLSETGKFQFGLLKALAHRGLGQLSLAEQEYQSLLVSQPDHIEALLGMATVYLFTDKIEQGQKLLSKAFSQAPQAPEALRLKALYSKDEAPQQALTYLQQAKEIEPDNINILANLANLYVELERYDDADMITNEILAIAPNHLETLLLKSEILRSLGKFNLSDKTLMSLSNNLSVIEDNDISASAELLLLDSMTNYAQGNLQEARSQLTKYVMNNEASIEAIMLLADVHVKLGNPREAVYLLEGYESELVQNRNFGLILAGLYFQIGQSFKAEPIVEKLFALYPKDPSVLIFYAHTLRENKQLRRAIEFLQQSGISDDPFVFRTLAALTFEAQQFDKSFAYIEQALKLAPENIDYQVFKVQALHQIGRSLEAEQAIAELQQQFPEEKLVDVTAAMLQMDLGNYQAAKAILDTLVLRPDSTADDELILAEIEYQLGNVGKAIEISEKVALQPFYRQQAYRFLADVYKEQGAYFKSLEIVNSLLSINRLDQDILALKVELLIEIGDKPEAQRYLDTLSKQSRGSYLELYQLALLNSTLENYKLAERQFSQSLKLKPKAVNTLVGMVKLKIRLNKIGQAEQLLAELIANSSKDNFIVNILLGDIAKVKGQEAEAYQHYANALKQDDDSSIALVKLSQISLTDSNLATSFTELVEQLLQKYPNRVFDRNLLAEHLMLQKQYNDAQYHYQKLLLLPVSISTRAIALNNLAVIAIANNSYDLAVSHSEQALKMAEPNVPAEFLDTFGWALTLSGDYQQGLSQLRNAHLMLSGDNNIKYHIAYALHKLDRNAEAKAMLLELQQVSTKFEEQQNAKQLLLEITS